MKVEENLIDIQEWTETTIDTTIKVNPQFQIWLITNGQLDLLVNGTRSRLRSGMALILDRGQIVKVEPKGEPFRLIVISVEPFDLFSPPLAELYVTPHAETSRSIVLHPAEPDDKAILDIIDKVIRSLKKKSSFALLDASLQLAVIWRYWIQQPQSRTKHHVQERMRLMLAYIHDHDTMKLTLEDIAATGGLSRAECCRYFTKWGDTSPLAYVQDIRMQRAARLLCETDSPVAEVANRFGFTSVSHFVQTFKKVHHQTPLAFRKQKT
ncbi:MULTISPECIES: helix-turn-helix domain-containing protein [Exiguobacterium]|uniref:helix-turn-helix domain-containing protein n=1 Tax=Exiguobacterium TaxID=33986 RepID=UPI001BE77338|nr:AraC family transcriptional regulator [Exiguobacterium sp. s150]